jgi:hypothetical protein
MNCWIRTIIILTGFLVLLSPADNALSQTETQKIDSTKTEKKLQDASRENVKPEVEKRSEEEIELAEINIEAVIEKPSVSIIPKRVAAELTEMEFIDRSFEKELKKAPNKPLIIDDRLFVPQKIENLKQKLIEKKQEEKK